MKMAGTGRGPPTQNEPPSTYAQRVAARLVVPAAHAGVVTTIDWQDEAACRDADPEWFIGEQVPDEVLHAAQWVCARCPVQIECSA